MSGRSEWETTTPSSEIIEQLKVNRGVAQSGSAPHWGCGGRRFKSCRPDQIKKAHPCLWEGLFYLSATASLFVSEASPSVYQVHRLRSNQQQARSAQPKSYLFRNAKNVALDQLRHQPRKPTDYLGDIGNGNAIFQ